MKKNIIIICLALLIMGCNTEKERVIDTTDPYLWLEDVEGADALDWVKSQNKITETRYAESEEFSSTYEELLKEYQSTDRIPYASVQGGMMYNFWRDEKGTQSTKVSAFGRGGTRQWGAVEEEESSFLVRWRQVIHKTFHCDLQTPSQIMNEE